MGFLDYYTEDSNLNEYGADGSALAGMVGDWGRKKDKKDKPEPVVGVPKNMWHIPKWGETNKGIDNPKFEKLKQSIENLSKELEVVDANNQQQGQVNPEALTNTQRFEKGSKLIFDFFTKFDEYSKMGKEDIMKLLPQIRKDSSTFKKMFKDMVTWIDTIDSGDEQSKLKHSFENLKAILNLDYKKFINHVKQFTDEDELTPAEKEKFAQTAQELKAQKEIPQGTPELKSEPKQEPEFVADNPETLPKISSKATKKKIIKSRPASGKPELEQRALSPDEIKSALKTFKKEKSTTKKAEREAKPLGKVSISPEKRRELADKRLKARKLTDGYTFSEHYGVVDDNSVLTMNLNEESPYLLNRIMGNVAGAIGKAIGGAAGAAGRGLAAMGKGKTIQANGNDIARYAGRGRFFVVPYSGYVAVNAACAQSMVEYKTLQKQKGVLKAKMVSKSFTVIRDRQNLEIDDDIIDVIKSLGYTPPNGVESMIVIECTLWLTSNGGNIIALSTLANPDEQDVNDASSKPNASVTVDADERNDMLFFVGCDAKGEKFFLDNFSMSFRQYLQNTKTASKSTISKQSAKMHQAFANMGLGDVGSGVAGMVQKTMDQRSFDEVKTKFYDWVRQNKNNVKVKQINNQNSQGGTFTLNSGGQAKLFGQMGPNGPEYKIQFTPEFNDVFDAIDPNGVDSYKQM